MRQAMLILITLQFMCHLCAAATIHVDDDHLGTADGTAAAPFATVQEAIEVAVQGDRILVAAGSYGGLTVDGVGVDLLGGYPGGTEQSYAQGTPGDFTVAEPSQHVSLLAGTMADPVVTFINASGSSIEGFTITGGLHGVLIDDLLSWPPQQGIRVAGNVIEGNGPEAAPDAHHGGGLYLSGSDITIEGNTIRANHAGRGAGIAGSGDRVLVHANRIEDNLGHSDHGGGVYVGGSVTITANLVSGNRTGVTAGYGWGGGILILGTARLEGNVVTANRAPSRGGGVFIDEGGAATLVNELVWGNVAEEEWSGGGAGIYVDHAWDNTPSSAEIVGCTVAHNLSPGTNGGNGLYVTGSDVVVRDSIFWGNGDDFFVSDSTLSATYTLSEEPLAGAGNLSESPLFADPATGDFHLRSSGGRWDPSAAEWVCDEVDSPAVDAGDPTSPWHSEPGPNGGRVNLGAYGNTTSASRSPGGCPVLFEDGFESGGLDQWSASSG